MSTLLCSIAITAIVSYYLGYRMWCWETVRRIKRVIGLTNKQSE